MLPFEFDYYRPDTIDEAIDIYWELESQGKQPYYYSGGSEIISMARVHNIFTQAVVDLKAIPECNVLEFQGDSLVLGSAVTLSKIAESKFFNLLEKTVSRIADHTMQCKITLGGNIAGTIIYKEAVLPLLLCDSHIVIASRDNPRTVPIGDVFNERLTLAQGEFIVKIITGKEYTTLPFVHVKRTKNEKIDYPLVSLTAIKKDNMIRIALSGICSFPFRSRKIEELMNDKAVSWDQRCLNALANLPAPILNDVSGSDCYRRFVLSNVLLDVFERLEGE